MNGQQAHAALAQAHSSGILETCILALTSFVDFFDKYLAVRVLFAAACCASD